MRTVLLVFLVAATRGASAQAGDILDRAAGILWIAHQYEGLDAPARVAMTASLGTTLVVPVLALSTADAGVPLAVAGSVALASLALGPEAGFIVDGSPRAGLTGVVVRAAAIGGTAALLLSVDLSNDGLGGVAVAGLLLVPGLAVVSISQGIDQARLRDHLRARTRARGGAPDLRVGLVRGGPGAVLRVPLP